MLTISYVQHCIVQWSISIQAIFTGPWPTDALVRAIDELLQQMCTRSIPVGMEEVLKDAVKFAAPAGNSLLAKCFGNRAAALLKRKCYDVGAVVHIGI